VTNPSDARTIRQQYSNSGTYISKHILSGRFGARIPAITGDVAYQSEKSGVAPIFVRLFLASATLSGRHSYYGREARAERLGCGAAERSLTTISRPMDMATISLAPYTGLGDFPGARFCRTAGCD